MKALLREGEIDYTWVISFTEDPDDVADALNRAQRAGKALVNPLESSLRFAGVSIAVENPVLLPEIGDLVLREFAVERDGSLSVEDAAARNERLHRRADTNTLAYEFPYYLVSLDERRLELAEWSRFAGLKVRIEIKTLLQDAWADVIDELPSDSAAWYPDEVSEVLRRSARSLSAVDAELAEADRTIPRLVAEYEEAVAAGDAQLPVNGMTLLAYLRASELVASLVELAEEVGLEPEPDYVLGWAEVEDLLWLLRAANVDTVAELEDFLQQATPRARGTLTELARVAKDRDFTLYASADHVVEFLWLVLRRADGETISLLRYLPDIEYALNTLIGNPVPADAVDET